SRQIKIILCTILLILFSLYIIYSQNIRDKTGIVHKIHAKISKNDNHVEGDDTISDKIYRETIKGESEIRDKYLKPAFDGGKILKELSKVFLKEDIFKEEKLSKVASKMDRIINYTRTLLLHEAKLDDITFQMMKNSLKNTGELEVFDRIWQKSNGNISITVVGGSASCIPSKLRGKPIATDVSSVRQSKKYFEIVSWFLKKLLGTHVSINNCAIGGTTSIYTSYCWRNFISDDTDLVLVEFAINDDGFRMNKFRRWPWLNNDPYHGIESLIRHVKSLPLEHQPVLILSNLIRPSLLYDPTNPSCLTTEDTHYLPIAKAYGVMSISWKEAVCASAHANRTRFRIADLANRNGSDGIHPSAKGHRQLGFLIAYGILAAYEQHVVNKHQVNRTTPQGKQDISQIHIPSSYSLLPQPFSKNIWKRDPSCFYTTWQNTRCNSNLDSIRICLIYPNNVTTQPDIHTVYTIRLDKLETHRIVFKCHIQPKVYKPNGENKIRLAFALRGHYNVTTQVIIQGLENHKETQMTYLNETFSILAYPINGTSVVEFSNVIDIQEQEFYITLIDIIEDVDDAQNQFPFLGILIGFLDENIKYKTEMYKTNK
ncbi:unnamed protein product, partial [Owenia fusiformis]